MSNYPEKNKNSIGRNIKLARIASDIKSKDLAEKLNISGAQMSRIETGKSQTTIENIITISYLTGTSIDQLLGFDTPNKKSPGNSLAEKMKILRWRNHIYQEDLAKQICSTTQQISRYETERAAPPIDKIVMMCQVFNTSPTDLLENEIAKTLALIRTSERK